MQTAALGHEPPPPAPRPLTPRAKSAAWNHPIVRFWRLVAIFMFAVAGYFFIRHTTRWFTEVQLVQSGQVVQGTVTESVDPIGGRHIARDAMVDIRYKVNGTDYKVTGYLQDQTVPYRNGGPIEIRVDPKKPWVWTNRKDRPSLLRALMATILLLPLSIVTGLLNYWLYRRVLRVWQIGQAEVALVADTHQTALAPLSRVVRCTLRDRKDSSLVRVYVPQKVARLHTADVIWLIAPPNNVSRAIAAMVYQD
jgi:hypothetical protein